MGYNISNWKTKKLQNLTIPLNVFFENVDWHQEEPVIINKETMEIELYCGCEQLIKGTLKDDIIHVTDLEMDGEGSGHFRCMVLDKALRQSKGELEAILVWEGGDSITKLNVKDGVIEETEL